MQYQTEEELNIIRGKARVGRASNAEIKNVFKHLDALIYELDQAEQGDFFGPKGWRHFFGLPDAN